MIEPTPPRTAGGRADEVPVRRAESSSSSSSEAAEDPWKPESPEPPPPPPPKLGEPAEELAFTESLYGLVPPPRVPWGGRRETPASPRRGRRRRVEARAAAARGKLEPFTVRRRRARGSAERRKRRRTRAVDGEVGTSRAPPRASSPRGTGRRRRRFDPVDPIGAPDATTFIPPPPPSGSDFPEVAAQVAVASDSSTRGRRERAKGVGRVVGWTLGGPGFRRDSPRGSRPGTAGTSRPGTAGTAGAAGVRLGRVARRFGGAHRYSEDFEDLEDLDLP